MEEREEGFVFEGDTFEKTVPVRVNGTEYTLKEASGEASVRYKSMMIGTMEGLVDGKPTKIRPTYAECDPFLVSLCLYEDGVQDKKNGGDRLVPLKTIKSWPSHIQRKLFDWIKKNSDLGEGEATIEQLEKQLEEAKRKEEAAKNELST